MRRHEKDFMLWRDDKYADEFKKAGSGLQPGADGNGLPYDVQERFR